MTRPTIDPVQASVHLEGITYRHRLVQCGRKTCRRCKGHERRHGPYWYATWRDGRKTKERYIGIRLPDAVLVALGRRPPPSSMTLAPSRRGRKGSSRPRA